MCGVKGVNGEKGGDIYNTFNNNGKLKKKKDPLNLGVGAGALGVG